MGVCQTYGLWGTSSPYIPASTHPCITRAVDTQGVNRHTTHYCDRYHPACILNCVLETDKHVNYTSSSLPPSPNLLFHPQLQVQYSVWQYDNHRTCKSCALNMVGDEKAFSNMSNLGLLWPPRIPRKKCGLIRQVVSQNRQTIELRQADGGHIEQMVFVYGWSH